MKDFLDVIKPMLFALTIFLAIIGLLFIVSKPNTFNNITYIQDGNYIDAIEYENKIYVRKEGI